MHIHRSQERRVWVKDYIIGRRELTDVPPPFQAVSCRVPIFNGEASGWESDDKCFAFMKYCTRAEMTNAKMVELGCRVTDFMRGSILGMIPCIGQPIDPRS